MTVLVKSPGLMAATSGLGTAEHQRCLPRKGRRLTCGPLSFALPVSVAVESGGGGQPSSMELTSVAEIGFLTSLAVFPISSSVT